jgi:hypothetical protein
MPFDARSQLQKLCRLFRIEAIPPGSPIYRDKLLRGPTVSTSPQPSPADRTRAPQPRMRHAIWMQAAKRRSPSENPSASPQRLCGIGENPKKRGLALRNLASEVAAVLHRVLWKMRFSDSKECTTLRLTVRGGPSRERQMLWAIVSIACIGILLGLRLLRVATIFAASLVLAVASTPLMLLLTEWSLLKSAGFLFVLVSVLQCGYLLGAAIASSQAHSRSPANVGLRPIHRPGRDEVPRIR